MALFSFYNREKFPQVDFNEVSVGALVIDLALGRVGASRIGEPPMEGEPFAAAIGRNCDIVDEGNGVEMNPHEGKLASVFVTLASFSGSFTKNGEDTELSVANSPSDVKHLFGEPYWMDESDGEVILFYEWNGGRFEVQFEFPDGVALGFITLVSPGVLATEAQRRSYGCDKPWPPTVG